MLKKAIKTFNRGLMIGFEIIGVLAVVVFLAWCGLIWRLSQGPLDIGFVTERMERSMQERNPDFKFDVGRTWLTWGGHFQPFEIELRDVTIARADDTPLLSIKKLGVQLSKRHLFLGKLMPKVIRIYHPSFRVIRWEDGHFSFNLNEAPLPVAGPPLPPDLAAEAMQARVDFIRSLLAQLRDHTGFAVLLGGLHEISIRHAGVIYEDKILETSWTSTDTRLTILRQKGGIDARAEMAVDVSADKRAFWTASVRHNWDREETAVVVSFSDLSLADLRQKNVLFEPLAGLEMSFLGAVRFTLDRDFKPGVFEFVLGGEEGSFSGFGLYDEAPLPVAALYVDGAADPAKGSLMIDQMKIDTGKGPKIDARLAVNKKEDGTYQAAVSGTLLQMPMDDLHQYWPEKLATDTREWVTTHLSAGTAHRATIEALATYAPAAETDKVSIEKLGGEIFYDGIKVDYFPPLMPVLAAKGRAYYDAKSFHLDISGGKLGDMTATKSTIHITKLDEISETQHAEIDIAVSLNGPLSTALSVLDAKPLQYPKMLGISSADVKGRADVDVRFSFPIHKELEVADVQVTARAKVHDAELKGVVAGLTLAGGPMDVQVGNGSLNIKGDARLAGTPVAFDWTKNFVAKSAYDQRVTAKMALDDKMLKHFGVPDMIAPKGRMASDIVYQRGFDGRAEMQLTGDLAGMGLTVPFVDFTKQPAASGGLSLSLALQNDSLRHIHDLSLETAGILVRGDLDFNQGADGKAAFSAARLSRLMYGETDIAITAEDKGVAGYALKVSGQQMDARPFTGGGDDNAEPAPNTDAQAAKVVTPLQVSMDVKRLILGKDRALSDVKMLLKRNKWQRIDQMEMDAVVGGKALYLRYMPEAAGGHSLRFEADNAGAALSVLGITKSIRGGTLAVQGAPNPKGGPRDLTGVAQLSNFSLKDTPVLAKLLNAMSLVGILDLLNGDGLSFSKARVNFSWTDRGQPQQMKNTRYIRLKDGRTSGASLGLTFEGGIDYWARQLDLDGTIIPVSGVSSIISGIPLLGDILTAGGEGLLAATYTIKGVMSQPVVSVNPLAVLAPGILRKVFFE